MNSLINCCSYRRFGVEIELNTLSGEITRPNLEAGEIPEGSDYVACLVRKATRDPVQISKSHYIHNNNNWVMKHDMSCGLEINSPVLKGWHGLKKLLFVVDSLSKDQKIKANNLCSLHVHINVSDLNIVQMATVIAYYIKCEHVFFDSVPLQRKSNRYCQMIGMTDWFGTDFNMEPSELITRVSNSKYGSINTFHFVRGGGFSKHNDRRKTIEFRIAENLACLDPLYVKNWIRLLLHFVEITKNKFIPAPYMSKYPKSGLTWLDFSDVYSLLKFDQEMTPGMQQVREWFMDRINNNGYDNNIGGVLSNAGRIINRKQFLEINNKLSKIQYTEDPIYDSKWIK